MVAIKKNEVEITQVQIARTWQLEFEQLHKQTIKADERLQWMMKLRDIYYNNTVDESGGYLLLQLALRLCDWSMVLDLTEFLLSKHKELFGDGSTSISQEHIAINRADAWIQIGMPVEAISTLRTTLFSHHQNSDLFSFYGHAQQALQRQHNYCWPVEACYDQTLLLTPLQSYHIESFRWIYSQYLQSKGQDQWQDQSIAQLCNLPRFKNDTDWQDWLQRHTNDPKCFLFSVVHSEWGIIGSVSLEIFNGVGFFYYWLGEDFQGMGFGPKAVYLLLDLGFDYLGMHCCYAKAYDYNEPSKKALQRIGFDQLSFRVKPPYNNENLYYFGEEKSEPELRSELDQLFLNMESELVLETTNGLELI